MDICWHISSYPDSELETVDWGAIHRVTGSGKEKRRANDVSVSVTLRKATEACSATAAGTTRIRPSANVTSMRLFWRDIGVRLNSCPAHSGRQTGGKLKDNFCP